MINFSNYGQHSIIGNSGTLQDFSILILHPSYQIWETKSLEMTAIAFVGILLVLCFWSIIKEPYIIFIGIAIAIIELIVYISNDKIDFFYKKLNMGETNRKK